jgi:hypothetical protein
MKQNATSGCLVLSCVNKDDKKYFNTRLSVHQELFYVCGEYVIGRSQFFYLSIHELGTHQ